MMVCIPVLYFGTPSFNFCPASRLY